MMHICSLLRPGSRYQQACMQPIILPCTVHHARLRTSTKRVRVRLFPTLVCQRTRLHSEDISELHVPFVFPLSAPRIVLFSVSRADRILISHSSVLAGHILHPVLPTSHFPLPMSYPAFSLPGTTSTPTPAAAIPSFALAIHPRHDPHLIGRYGIRVRKRVEGSGMVAVTVEWA